MSGRGGAMQTYWDRVLNNRVSRRRAMATAGGAGAAAALLAACGGSNSEDSGAGKGQKDSSGLLFTPSDETKNAKRGGMHVAIQGNGLVTHDPHRIGAHTTVTARTYSQ